MHTQNSKGSRAMLLLASALVVVVFCLSLVEPPGSRQHTGYPQLVSVQDLPTDPEWCPPTPPALPEETNLFAAFSATSAYAGSQESGQTGIITRPPIRTIRDKDPIYSAVAVDTRFDEVILMDNNNWGLRVFNRLDNTPAAAPFTEPKRIISGPETDIQFNNGMYIDPKNGDIYSVETDTGDKVVVFDRTKQGDVEPDRILRVPHRGFSLAVDEEKQELYVGVQYPPQVPVYRKTASGDEKPLRSLQGESTRLSDTHGVALDARKKLMFVNNWGHVSDYLTAGTGRFEDASITVYSLDATGDAPPLRAIQGPKTQLNWPAAMSLDPDTGDLYVANDVGQSIVVFKETDKGNAAPSRVIKGSKTRLSR